MKTKFNLITFLIGFLLLASCSSSHVLTNTQQNYQPTQRDEIDVFSNDQTGREYVIVAELVSTAEDWNGAKGSVKQLKKEAAKVGANGIINLKLSITPGLLGDAIVATGTAIKYINP